MKAIDLPNPPRKILLIKPSAIGDVVHALPVLKLLRERFPKAHIAWLVTPGCAGLLEGHPLLDEVIRFERKQFGSGWRNPSAMRRLQEFVQSLRERKFDLVVDLQGLLRSGWLAWRTGARTRVGFANARELGWIFYTHRVAAGAHRVPAGAPGQHAVDRYLAVAEALGCAGGPAEFVFNTDETARREVAALLPRGPFAVLLPGTNWETKRWPVEKFSGLVEPLREQFGLKTVVAGGGAIDAELARQIPADVNLTNKISLKQLPALLERASLVVANDSGPMHIAAALGRPLATPFGPTNPTLTGPYQREKSVVRLNIECSPCYSRKCWHQSCLRKLEIETVLEVVREQMEGKSR